MDIEKLKRRQSLKVIISEVVMVLTVIVTVIILALVVSGYWLNSDFEVERQGMLQIYSTPTGANVDIDGESSWLQRTNTSKVLSKGRHTVTLTKDGYDSWSKTFDISEGLLYRIHYPRLFLQNRYSEKVFNTEGTIVASISADHENMVLIDESFSWKLIRLNSDEVSAKTIDVARLFPSANPSEEFSNTLFTGKILESNWDQDGAHLLLKIQFGENIEWVLIDPKNPEKSINLTRNFGDNFSDIKILDSSSNNLLVVQNNNLRKIDVSGKSISNILAENIIDFDHFNNEIVFSAKNSTENLYYIGYFKVGDESITKIETIPSPSKVAISRFYDDKFITVITENKVEMYKKDNFEPFKDFEIGFTPEAIEVGEDGNFIVVYNGINIATLDMESLSIREWTIENENFGWLDNNMIYVVGDGDLVVYDYDGLNRRIISKEVSGAFPAGITNNKWLYYFSGDNLIREWLIPR